MDRISGIARRVRVNHGLEHATITTLLGRGVRPPLGGYSTANGFYVFGRITTKQLTAAARDALESMKDGHAELAVSPHCGTNLAIGGIVSGVVSGLVRGRSRGKGRRAVALAAGITAAILASRPLGEWVQRRFTTSADVDRLEIAGVRRLKGGRFTIHRVQTRKLR